MESRDQTVRANAVLLLGKVGDRKDLDLLYSVLRDANSTYSVRLQVLEAIARLGNERIYERLWSLLISKFADDKVIGIRAMGALNTIDAKDSLVKMLYDDVPEVQLCAAEELGRLGDMSGQPNVWDYFTKQSPNLNKESVANILAARAIGRIGGSLTGFLPGLLDSRSKAVRLNAALAVLLLTR